MKKIITNSEREQLLNKKALLEKKIQENLKKLSNAHSNCISDSNDTQEFRSIWEEIEMDVGNLEKIKDILKNSEIYVSKNTNCEIVDINDTVEIGIIEEDLTDTYVVQLVGVKADLSGNVQKITIDSPLGNAIYGKTVGTTVNYTANGKPFTVKINQKISENTLEDDNNKNLSK